jgi:hypothetical protein
MIGIPPGFPVTPLTMAKESQKPHEPKVLERILHIEIRIITKEYEYVSTEERKG